MRGYGQRDAPQEIDRYTVLHAVGDMVGLLDALGIAQAVIAGHDWGATVAWLAAQLRPDRFPAVIALSVPYRARGAVRPTSVMPQTDEAIWYQLYFQEPGLAGSARTSCEPVQGCDPAAGVRHPGDDHGHGKRRPQCDQALSRSRRERGRHVRQRAGSRGDAGWTHGHRGGRGDESRR